MTASYLLKFALPLVASVGGLRAARRRGLSLSDDLGLRAPQAIPAVGWSVLWLLWLVVSEWLIVRLDLAQAATWPPMPLGALAARAGALAISGPAAEEFVARGLAFALLRRRGWSAFATIGVTSVAWAAAHYRYGPGTVGLIAIDGLLLGAARVTTGSLWVPFGMHVAANAISVTQSLGWWAR